MRAVRRAIPLRDMRMRVTETLVAACEAFEKEQPDADRTAYYERFGTPQQVAKIALENTETDVLYREITRSKRIWKIALIVGILIALGFGITYAWFVREVKSSQGGYFIDIGPHEETGPFEEAQP